MKVLWISWRVILAEFENETLFSECEGAHLTPFNSKFHFLHFIFLFVCSNLIMLFYAFRTLFNLWSFSIVWSKWALFGLTNLKICLRQKSQFCGQFNWVIFIREFFVPLLLKMWSKRYRFHGMIHLEIFSLGCSRVDLNNYLSVDWNWGDFSLIYHWVYWTDWKFDFLNSWFNDCCSGCLN